MSNPYQYAPGGKTPDGMLTGYNEEKIRLKPLSGKVTELPISSLSTVDQTFVAAMKKGG